MKKFLVRVSELLWRLRNRVHGYHLSKSEIKNLLDTINLRGEELGEGYYDELYSRAIYGDKDCLDLLLKITSIRSKMVCDIDLNDCVVVNFRGDKQLHDGVNKIKAIFNGQEIIIKGTRVFMKFWIFVYIFGKDMVGPETPLEFDTNLTFVKLED